MPIKIYVNPEKNEDDHSETLFGPVHFETTGVCFPEALWGDFVVVILSWWVRELGTYDGKKPGGLFFMDGPFRVEFKPIRDGHLALLWIENDRSVGNCELELHELREALEVAVQATLQHYHGVSRRDVNELRDAWKRFGWSTTEV